MTPEERAGLRPSGYWWQTIEPNHCNHGSWSPCPLVGHTDAPLYTLDPAVLSSLLQRHDKAVELVGLLRHPPFHAYVEWRETGSTPSADAMDEWESVARRADAFLAALGEVPK